MEWVAAIAGSAVLLLAAAPAVAPPPGPATWRQLGAVVSSRPGKALHFYRMALNPQGLAIVVSSSASRPFRGFWASDCQVNDDDTMEEQHQGPLTGAKRVVAYPAVLPAATSCYLWVNVTAPSGATITAAEFAH